MVSGREHVNRKMRTQRGGKGCRRWRVENKQISRNSVGKKPWGP